MTTNLLKRLESSVEAFRLTLQSLHNNHTRTLNKIDSFKVAGRADSISDWTGSLANLEAEEDDIPVLEDSEIGGKVKINLIDMDLPSWEHDLKVDLEVINALLSSMAKVTPEDDAKLQHLKALILSKIENPINDGNKKFLFLQRLPTRPITFTTTWRIPYWQHRGCTPEK